MTIVFIVLYLLITNQMCENNMNIKQKHELLDFAFDIESRGVKVSIDFSINQIVTITIWSSTEECKIDMQKVFHSADNMLVDVLEVETFLKNRKFEMEVA